MVETANIILLLVGFILVWMSLENFVRAFAFWCALSPLVASLPSFEGWDIFPSSRIITSGLFVIALFRFQAFKNQFPRGPFWRTYLLFILSLFISAAISTQPVQSFGRALTFVEPLMWALMAAVSVLSNKEGMRIIGEGIIWGFVGVTIYAIVELIYQKNFLFDMGLVHSDAQYIEDVRFGFSGRLFSTIGQPVGASLYLVATLPLVLFYGKYFTKLRLHRLILFLMFVAGLACLIFTGTRAGYVAILLVPLVYYLFSRSSRRRRKILLFTYAISAVIILYVLPSDFLQYLADSFKIGAVDTNPAATNVVFRIELTRSLLEIARDNLLFGLGPGFVQRMAFSGAFSFAGLGGSENQYAILLADSGIVSVFAYAMFVFSAVRVLVSLRRHKSVVKSQWGALSASIFISILIAAISVNVLNSLIMIIVMIYLGMAVVFEMQMKPSPQTLHHDKSV
jgi:hypothetical protein